MVEHLDLRQRNNLRIGNALAAEVLATAEGRRAFVTVWPYHVGDNVFRRKHFSKVLNRERDFEEDVRFSCSVFEVEKTALQTYLEQCALNYYPRLDIDTLSKRTELTSIDEVEAELCLYLDDLSKLDVRWRVIPNNRYVSVIVTL